MATAFKLKGNEAFKGGDYAAAIGAYTSAMMADPQDATFPLNRAAAYLKLSKFQDAEGDCTKVLSLDPKNIKALFRRGQARAGLESYLAAKTDLDQVLALTPNDPTAKAELSKVQQAIATAQKLQQKKGKAAPLDDVPPLAPYRRRVPIEVVEGTTTNASTRTAPKKENISSEKKGALVQETSERNPLGIPSTAEPKHPLIEELPDTSPTPNPVPIASSKTFQQAKQERETRVPRKVGGGILKRDGSHSDAMFTAKAIVHERSAGPPERQAQSSEADRPINGSTAAGIATVIPPANPFEFQRQWQSASSEGRWAILQAIPPETLPVFFKNSMEPPLLSSIFKVLYDVSPDPKESGTVAAYLPHLKKIPRFETLTLFFSDAEQKIVQELTG